MKVSLRAAIPDEANRLSEIACQAKAHWGYAAEPLDCISLQRKQLESA